MLRTLASIAPLVVLFACSRSSESSPSQSHAPATNAAAPSPSPSPSSSSTPPAPPFTWSIKGGPTMEGHALLKGSAVFVYRDAVPCDAGFKDLAPPWFVFSLHPGPGARWFAGEPTIVDADAMTADHAMLHFAAKVTVDAGASSLEGAPIAVAILPDGEGHGPVAGSGTLKPIVCKPPKSDPPLADTADAAIAHGHVGKDAFTVADAIAFANPRGFAIALYDHAPAAGTSWCNQAVAGNRITFTFTRRDPDVREGVDVMFAHESTSEGWARLKSVDVAGKKIQGELVASNATSAISGTFNATICATP